MEPGWTPRPRPTPRPTPRPEDILLKNNNGRYKHIVKDKNKWKIYVHINYKNHKNITSSDGYLKIQHGGGKFSNEKDAAIAYKNWCENNDLAYK